MSDPLINDGSRPVDLASVADREAKIEQLLLLGLDHYFASQYEQAINVWTRALFLDRAHPRARAYIDRARSALAERQRQSEELLQHGVAAFHRGEGPEARRLLQAAIANGAPAEEALAVLHRLDRLGPPPSSVLAERDVRPIRQESAAHGGTLKPRPRVGTGGTVGLALLLLAGVYVAVARTPAQWWRSLTGPPEDPGLPIQGPIARTTPLPLPRRGETAVARAQALFASGRLHDALTVLEDVRPSDPERPNADRLRADIQRRLLAFGSGRRTP